MKEAIHSFQNAARIVARHGAATAAIWAAAISGTAVWTFSQTPVYRPEAMIEIRPNLQLFRQQNDLWVPVRYLWEVHFRTEEQEFTLPSTLTKAIDELPQDLKSYYQASGKSSREFIDGVRVEADRSRFLVNVSFIHPDATTATRVTNSIAETFVRESRRRFEDFSGPQPLSPFEETLRTRLTELSLKKNSLKAQRDALRRDDPASLPLSIQRHPRLERLLSRRTELRNTLAVDPEGAASSKAVTTELQRIELELAQAMKEISGSLDGELEMIRSDEEALTKEQERATALHIDPGTVYVRLVDAAQQPTTPWKPQTKINLVFGAALGFFLAIVGAHLLELRGDRRSNPLSNPEPPRGP